MESLFRAWPMFHVRVPVGQPVELPGDLPQSVDGADWPAILATLATEPQLSEAVALASIELSRAVDTVLAPADGAAPASASLVRRSAQSLLRYQIRGTTRPTPFGLFAGTCFGHFDSASKLELEPGARTHTHLDLSWLLALVERLQARPEVLPQLTVIANEAIVLRGGRVLLETPSTYGIAAGGDGRSTVSARASRPVLAALEQAAGPRPVADLVEVLAGQFPTAGRGKIVRLVTSLVQQDLLLTDLRPALDGRDPLRELLRTLRLVPAPPPELARIIDTLQELDQLRTRYDTLPIGQGKDVLRDLQRTANSLGPTKTALHVDTTLAATVSLNHIVRTEAEQAVSVLWRLSEPRLGMRALRQWHARFLERYGIGRLVDIGEAIDDTIGLGAPGGYAWPLSEAAEPDPAPPTKAQIKRDVALGRLFHECLAAGRDEIVLTDADIADLELTDPQTERLPASCELFLQLVADSTQAVDNGDFRLVVSQNPGSHRAGASLSRFAYTDPTAEFAELVRATPTSVPGALPVDLTYATRGPRAANILNVATYHDHRIAVSLPDGDIGDRVRLADLAVGATLDELYLVHKRTGQLVEPVALNMTSPATQAPNIARLLFELGMEGRRLWEPWSWGQLSVHPVLPRVRYGRTVLCPRTWKVDDLRAGLLAARSAPQRRSVVCEWQQRWSVPRMVLAVSADQRLLFDLTVGAHVELLAQEIERDARLMLQEPATACHPDGWFDGGRPAELVIPFVRRPDLAGSPPMAASPELTATIPTGPGRLIPACQDWLYLCIYTSRRSQDDLLRKQVRPLLTELTGLGVERWFFIRYSDEQGQHLRLRLHGQPSQLRGNVLETVTAAVGQWRAAGLLGPVRWCDYDPEFERYGGPDVSREVHAFFEADSAFAMAALDIIDSGAFDRHTVAAVSALSLVHDFGPPGGIRDPAVEHRPGPGQPTDGWWLAVTGDRPDLPAQYRKRQTEWRRLLDPRSGWAELAQRPAGTELLDALRAREPATVALADALRALGTRCPTPARRMVGSLLHMTCNRLLGGYPDLEALALGLARGAAQDNERAAR